MKLMMSDFSVEMPDDGKFEFLVAFPGPADTPYHGGVWNVLVALPPAYPFKSPSIGFRNRMFHPNVDEGSGSVCLDVINQTWSPMFDLVNVFEQFLPQLLRYPNPSDPLNGEAAALLLREPEKYNARIREYVKRYATPAEAKAEADAGTPPKSRAAGGAAARSPSEDSVGSSMSMASAASAASAYSAASADSGGAGGAGAGSDADMGRSSSSASASASASDSTRSSPRDGEGEEDDDDDGDADSVVSDLSELSAD